MANKAKEMLSKPSGESAHEAYSELDRVMLRPSEVARAIGVSRTKVYELVASGALPAVRLEGGRLIRIPAAALQRMAAAALNDGTQAGHPSERAR